MVMKLTLHKKLFSELTTDELYELLRIRSEVFVVEQNCVYQDMDMDDQASIHLWLTDQDRVVALCRVCPAGTHMKEVSIGRVITTERGKGYGKRIMLAGIEAAKEHFGATTIEIEAHANPGYVFAGWSDGDHNNPRQIIVTAATTYTANFQQTSGIANPGAQASAINVYPNPASDVVCIEIQNPDRAMRNYEVALIDLSGRTCQTAIAEGNSGSVDNIRLDITDLPQGSYFVRIQAEGVSLVRKFVKK